MNLWNEDCFDQDTLCDPLQLERSAPIKDEEAACLERLCEAATPGPLFIDDAASGAGAVVATLPDGRHIISLSPGSVADSELAVQANARLMCQARYAILRLLRDRARWQRDRQQLLARIESLEAAKEQTGQSPDWHAPRRAISTPLQPR